MNTRERFLAIFLIVVMVAVAGGFIGWQMIYSPWKKHNEAIAKLRDEVDELQTKKLAIETAQYIYENKTRKKSLPPDVAHARSDYGRFLDRMLSQAKFAAPVITPREPDTKDVPLVSNKKPAYVKLDYDLQVKGDLTSLIDFLYMFYRQPFLHQIRKITILKPSTSRGENRGTRDLEVTMTVEALVLDKAEPRPMLFPMLATIGAAAGGAGVTAFALSGVENGFGSAFTAANVLARADDSYTRTTAQAEYRRIAGKNIFFDPPKVSVEVKPKVEDEQPKEEAAPKEPDLAPFLMLTRISHSGGKSNANIFNRSNKDEYEIELNNRGDVRVIRYWYNPVAEPNGLVIESRKKYPERPYLQFGTEEGGNQRLYTVHRILENELLLETIDAKRARMIKFPVTAAMGGLASVAFPGKMYLWRVGQFLKSEEPGKSMREITQSYNKLDALTRPVMVDNEGEAEVNTPGEKPESKSGSSKRR